MACFVYLWTEEKRGLVEEAIRSSRTRADAAKKLGITKASFDHACDTYGFVAGRMLNRKAPKVEVEVTPPTPDRIPTDELLAARKRRFEIKARAAETAKLIPVRVKDPKPIGLFIAGDPHVDDDGCNLALLEEHVELVKRTDGLYAINAGDTTNNWTGRLARLYASQGTSAAEGWQLAEWFVGSLRHKWLAIIGGNHDCWSGAGDPLIWITGQVGALYQPSSVRLGIRFPGGLEVRANCRHDFAGHSQWNPAHGPMKAAALGYRDHLNVAGHLHISAYGVQKDPDSGITMHGVMVASYKIHDAYAVEKGLRDQHLSPCALVTINTALPDTHPDLIKVWWHPEEGADFLAFLRRRKAA